MITTERKYYLIRMRCQNRIWSSTALALISGVTSHLLASKGSMMMKVDFIKCIERCLRKLKVKRLSILR
jgi:hypothetical protein